jgi:hypothetical protein
MSLGSLHSRITAVDAVASSAEATDSVINRVQTIKRVTDTRQATELIDTNTA